MKDTIEQNYTPDEYNRAIPSYRIYLQALEQVLDMSIADSFLDLGCSNGKLLETIMDKYPHMEIQGYDYFADWAKKYAHPRIAEKINQGDLGTKISFAKKYNIVNCSEVGEHVEPQYEEILLQNLADATDDILILTWSNQKEDDVGQHVNPQPISRIIRKVSRNVSYNLSYWAEATEKLRDFLRINLEGVGNNWWADNIAIFKKKKWINVASRYQFQKIHTDNSSHARDLKSGIHFSNFFSWLRGSYSHDFLQNDFLKLGQKIKSAVASNTPTTFLRASDGDLFFLRKIEIGSASPGRRALTVSYADLNIELFRSMFWHNSVITLNTERGTLSSWRVFIMMELIEKVLWRLTKRKVTLSKKMKYALHLALRPLTIFGLLPCLSVLAYSIKRGGLYRRKAFDLISQNVPASEAIYALIGTKWIFRNFPNEIGLIGNGKKISLIKTLMEKPEYRQEIGVQSFADYIELPQKGAADDVTKLAREIGEQIKNSKAKVFLIGAGSSKIALLPMLKAYTNAVLIDAGVGIDALAGVACQERPYFADWINFRIKDKSYDDIDLMDQGNPAWKTEGYITREI